MKMSLLILSYAFDLNKSVIKWESGGNIVLSGYGKTSYTFKAFGPNTTTSINVSITPPNTIATITKNILISPAEVGLLWESVGGYAPPFYKGKTFVSREGWIKTVAIPNTNLNNNGTGKFTYTWSSNDNNIQSASGYGKDSYVFKNSILKNTENITVIASSVDGSYNATKTIDIPTISPKLIFYKRSPTEGILYNNALKDGDFMQENEMTIVAEPYFLSLKGNESNFTYKWSVNGKDIETPSNKSELTVRPGSRGGYATIPLTIQNLKTLFQEVTNQLKLSL